MMRMLKIDAKELYFSAAHWLPGHPKCGVLHGHTYFVKKLEVIVEGFVDLNDIKDAIKSFDHMPLIPESDAMAWSTLCDLVNRTEELESLRQVFSKQRIIIDTDLPGTSVERIAEELKAEIEGIPGVVEAHFELYEGPTAGRKI